MTHEHKRDDNSMEHHHNDDAHSEEAEHDDHHNHHDHYDHGDMVKDFKQRFCITYCDDSSISAVTDDSRLSRCRLAV